MNLKYFVASEFENARPACSLSDMDEGFMQLLDTARHIAQVPFIINSAYRSKDYELSQGRKGTSSHCKGVAVDIHCINPAARIRIITGLIKAGFSRIGIGKTFIHVDYDKEKDSTCWLYK